MAILISNLALRRAPIAFRTSIIQCRGVTNKHMETEPSDKPASEATNTKLGRKEAAWNNRSAALERLAREEKTPTEMDTVQDDGGLRIRRINAGDPKESKKKISRTQAIEFERFRRDLNVSHGDKASTGISGFKIYRIASERTDANPKPSTDQRIDQKSDISAASMFSPTRPQQAKASTRRHLTPYILNELLGESPADPVKPTVPPLNMRPESVGLPSDVSWRPLADKDHKEFLHSDHAQVGASPSEPLVSRLRDKATVLVFSCASRTLALSDFIRLSPHGKHIEGWTSGIVRVIPGRNPSTLERTNHYFLVFSTSAAAAGYAENISRIHALARKWMPQRPQDIGVPTPGVEIGKHGEDVGALVRSYTLLPNTQQKVFMRRLQKPYRPAMARVVETGAYHNVLAQEKDRPGENLVLFQLDEGLMSGRDLMKFIEADGRRRNLNWRLEGNAEGDIKQYGGGGKNDASRSEEEWADEEGEENSGEKRERRRRRSVESASVFPRHIVRFRDAVEAKRFVRAWHTRILEGEPWDKLAENSQWGGAKVSAEILW